MDEWREWKTYPIWLKAVMLLTVAIFTIFALWYDIATMGGA